MRPLLLPFLSTLSHLLLGGFLNGRDSSEM